MKSSQKNNKGKKFQDKGPVDWNQAPEGSRNKMSWGKKGNQQVIYIAGSLEKLEDMIKAIH